MEERKDVGRALSVDKQKALLDGLKDRRTPHLGTLIPLLLLTGMRAGEALSLTWAQVDLMGKTIAVGRAKTSSGTGRMIPINDDLASILAAHRARALWRADTSAPLFREASLSLPIRRGTPRTLLGDGTTCGRIRASP